MFQDQELEYFRRSVRTLQIIVFGMVMGVILFLVIAVFQGQPQPAGQPQPMISYVALAFTAAVILARTIVPNMIARQGRKAIADGSYTYSGPEAVPKTPEERDRLFLTTVFQTRLLIACALLEGAAFFNLVSYMVEGLMVNLLIGAALAGAVLCHMPTSGSLRDWVAREKDEIRQLRSE